MPFCANASNTPPFKLTFFLALSSINPASPESIPPLTSIRAFFLKVVSFWARILMFPPFEFSSIPFAEITAFSFITILVPASISILPALRLFEPSFTTFPLISTLLTALITISPFSATILILLALYPFTFTTSLKSTLLFWKAAPDKISPLIFTFPAPKVTSFNALIFPSTVIKPLSVSATSPLVNLPISTLFMFPLRSRYLFIWSFVGV